MSKLAPLAELTRVDGLKYIFDPANVSAVYAIPTTIYEPGHPGRASIKTHVWGVTAAPSPIDEKPDEFLRRLAVLDDFVVLTCPGGPAWIKATAVSLLAEKYPGESDQDTKCFLLLSPDATEIWHIKEDVPSVRAKIDAIRRRPDAADA
jgi:hypothetical protein